MNAKKLLLKFAALGLGLAVLHTTAPQAKAWPDQCPMNFCSTATSGGHCGYEPWEDCGICYGDDGSIGTDTTCRI